MFVHWLHPISVQMACREREAAFEAELKLREAAAEQHAQGLATQEHALKSGQQELTAALSQHEVIRHPLNVLCRLRLDEECCPCRHFA